MTLRLAMLGMVQGNGHPYSCSAIISGREPFHFAQTVGQMKIIVAGQRSRRCNGRTDLLTEIEA